MENFEGIRLPWAGWEIVRYIGGGGYGKVYEIERNMAGVQEKAAVKIVSRPQDENELNDYYDNGYDEVSAKKSFESELQSYAKEYQLMKELQGQSNIVSCDDFAIVSNANGIGGQIFFRMELLTSLQHLLRERTLSESEIIKLGKDISRALILCENSNIIHRDIKPQNILVSRFGDYKLGDFGVSKVMDHATFATSQGTIGFQAPEVVHMEKYGHRADIYSLGVTMYWLLNNKKMPFVGADEILTPTLKAEANQRRYSGEKLPAPKNGSAELKNIVLKACAYRPEERYTSAEELYKALEGLESNSKAKSGKTTNTKARTAVNSSDTSEDNCGETNQTVGAYKNSTTASKATADDYEEEQTGSADWGETVGTIGAPGKNVKKQTSNTSEQEENETIGAKQAYQKQAKQKATANKVKETAKKNVQAASEKKNVDSEVEGWMCFWPGFALVLCWLISRERLERIVTGYSHGIWIFEKGDWIHGGTFVIACIALITGILYYRRAKKGNKKRKMFGFVYICSMVLLGVGFSYVFIWANLDMSSVDSGYKNSPYFWSVLENIILQGGIVGTVVWLINMVRKDLKKIDSRS